MQVLYAPSYVFKVMVRFGTIIEKTSPPPATTWTSVRCEGLP